MTPDEYLRDLDRLLDDGEDREALEFAARVQPTVRPPLTGRQLDRSGAALHVAAMRVAMRDAEQAGERSA